MTKREHEAYQALCDIDDTIRETIREMIVAKRNTLVRGGLTPHLKDLYQLVAEPIEEIEAAKAELQARDRERRQRMKQHSPTPLRIGSILRKQIG